MKFSEIEPSPAPEVIAIFRDAFSASEGAEEGALIAGLARDLLAETPRADIRIFVAAEGARTCAAIIFTRLYYPEDARKVLVLGPVAVAPDAQRTGIGQGLIGHGLQALRTDGADVAVTYGDPAYYSKTGFRPVTEDLVPAPYPLRHPEGWLAQSLTGGTLAPLPGPATCVAAFRNPEFW